MNALIIAVAVLAASVTLLVVEVSDVLQQYYNNYFNEKRTSSCHIMQTKLLPSVSSVSQLFSNLVYLTLSSY